MAAWLSPRSSKKKDTYDIRDFITVHGKIVKTSSPVEHSNDSKHVKTKQLKLVHCHGQNHDRANEAPATKFSTGVRKKAAVVDLIEQDCQEQPFTDSIKENLSPRQCKHHGNTPKVIDPRKARKRTVSGRSRSLAESTNDKRPPKHNTTSPSAKKHLCSTSRGQSTVSKRAKLVSQWDNAPTSYKSPKQQKNSKSPAKTKPHTTTEHKRLHEISQVHTSEDTPPLPLGEQAAVEQSSSAKTDADGMSSLELFDRSPGNINLPLASTCVKNSSSTMDERISCPWKGVGSSSVHALGDHGDTEDLLGSSNVHALGDHGDTDDLLAELSMYEKILLDQP